MAFKAFQTDRHNDDTTLPWSEQYINDNPDCIGSAYDVRTIRLTQKGMMIATDVSKAFIYKSHQTYNHVVEFVEGWAGKKTASPLLQVQMTTHRPFIILGVDDVRSGMWSAKSEDSWRQAYATVSDNPTVNTNPLPLPPAPSGDSVLSDDSNPHLSDARSIPIVKSQDLPLEEPARRVNGVKGRNTRKG